MSLEGIVYQGPRSPIFDYSDANYKKHLREYSSSADLTALEKELNSLKRRRHARSQLLSQWKNTQSIIKSSKVPDRRITIDEPLLQPSPHPATVKRPPGDTAKTQVKEKHKTIQLWEQKSVLIDKTVKDNHGVDMSILKPTHRDESSVRATQPVPTDNPASAPLSLQATKTTSSLNEQDHNAQSKLPTRLPRTHDKPQMSMGNLVKSRIHTTESQKNKEISTPSLTGKNKHDRNKLQPQCENKVTHLKRPPNIHPTPPTSTSQSLLEAQKIIQHARRNLRSTQNNPPSPVADAPSGRVPTCATPTKSQVASLWPPLMALASQKSQPEESDSGTPTPPLRNATSMEASSKTPNDKSSTQMSHNSEPAASVKNTPQLPTNTSLLPASDIQIDQCKTVADSLSSKSSMSSMAQCDISEHAKQETDIYEMIVRRWPIPKTPPKPPLTIICDPFVDSTALYCPQLRSEPFFDETEGSQHEDIQEPLAKATKKVSFCPDLKTVHVYTVDSEDEASPTSLPKVNVSSQLLARWQASHQIMRATVKSTRGFWEAFSSDLRNTSDGRQKDVPRKRAVSTTSVASEKQPFTLMHRLQQSVVGKRSKDDNPLGTGAAKPPPTHALQSQALPLPSGPALHHPTKSRPNFRKSVKRHMGSKGCTVQPATKATVVTLAD